LANAYARAGQPGLAVLNYERARLLDPADPDIDANLQRVRAKAGQARATPSNFVRLSTSLESVWLFWAGTAGVLIAGASMLARRRYRTHRGKLGLAAFLGVLLIAAATCNAIALWPVMHEAIVVAHSAPVRVSPVEIGDPLFTLTEAQTVMMQGEHDGFVLIRTAEGHTGWTPAGGIAPIVAPR
jgi:hypothetical protein